jgi:hypothetical protein
VLVPRCRASRRRDGADRPRLRAEGTFIERCKDLLDELNADHARGALAPTEFIRSTLSMHFYDSAVVLEKGRHTSKQAPAIRRRS